jgi:hypothetical protein
MVCFLVKHDARGGSPIQHIVGNINEQADSFAFE